MKNMSYKTFTFPQNPTKIEITVQNLIATAYCPQYGPLQQLICPSRRIISGSGLFFGSDARNQYCALETLFWEGTAGTLYIPDIGQVTAYFSELSLTEEGDGSYLRYRFRFAENITATSREGKRYVN